MSSDVRVSKAEYGNGESLLGTVLLWAITVYQLALVVPFVWLLLVPYYGSGASSGAYLDPRNVAPFGWHGDGKVLYDVALATTFFVGPFSLFGLLRKAAIMKDRWYKLRNVAGAIHG
jgi:hypothetical protein